MAGQAGFECTLKLGAQTVGKCQSNTLEFTCGEVETTVRDSSGWKEFVYGLKEWGLSLDHLWVPDDTALQTIRSAIINRTNLAVEILDKDDIGFTGTCIITQFNRGEPIGDAVTVPITAKGTGALTVVDPTS